MSASHPLPTNGPASFDLQTSRSGSPRSADEHSACRREIQRLLIENARLAADLSNTRARYDDLKQSTEIWIRLYERRLPAPEPRS